MQGKKIETEKVDPASPQARGLSNDLINYSQNIFDRGPRQVTPLSSAEQTGLGALESTLTNPTASTMGQPLMSDILSGKNLSPDSNPYLGQVLGGLRSEADKNLGVGMNQLDMMFGRTGMVNGSGRSAEAVNLAEKSTSDLNTVVANMLSNLYNQGTQNQLSVLGMLPSYDTSNVNNILSALSGLSLPRQIEDAQAGYDYGNVENNALLLAQILGAQPGFNYVTPEYAPSAFAQTATGVGSLLSGVGSILN